MSADSEFDIGRWEYHDRGDLTNPVILVAAHDNKGYTRDQFASLRPLGPASSSDLPVGIARHPEDTGGHARFLLRHA
jgi:hypothetical protein